MEYFSACYQQKEDNPSSLLLQQYQYRNTQVVFACICAKKCVNGFGEEAGRAGAYMTERLLGWFRGLNLKKLIKSREKKGDILLQELTDVIEEADRELEAGRRPDGGKVDLAGILCVGDTYIMLYRGTPEIYLINTAFGRVCLRKLKEAENREELTVRVGSLEPDVGLLLATEGFCSHVTEVMIKEGLFVREITTEEQMERHLAELGRESEARGGRGIGAVMLRTGTQ